MLHMEIGRLVLPWLPLIPLAQTLQLELSGFAILLIFMAVGGYAGYQQGMRNILTVAIWTIAAYVLCVQGGTFLIDVINRFWSNGPRLFAFLIGNNPNTVAPLDPLIEPGFQIPLFFRVVLFIALILTGYFFNRKSAWKGPPKEPLAKPLGLFVGGLIALLWTNAAVVFWNEFVNTGGGFGGPIATILNTLPDVSPLMIPLIVIFVMILVILIAFNFPKVWKP